MNKTILLAGILTSVGFSQSVLAGGDAAAGKTIAEQTCQACHGVNGNSSNAQYPKLAGQHADYIVRALTDYKSGTRKNPVMSGFASGLSAQDRKDVAAWFSQQEASLFTPELARTVQ